MWITTLSIVEITKRRVLFFFCMDILSSTCILTATEATHTGVVGGGGVVYSGVGCSEASFSVVRCSVV